MTQSIDELVGMNLQSLRQELKLSEADCAAALRLDVELYRACEAGTRRLRAGQIVALAERLRVPLSRLYQTIEPASLQSARSSGHDSGNPDGQSA